MSRRSRDRDDLHGFLNVCKAPGFTSHDVVAVVRRTLGTRRVGHAGTLDPAAEGVLPICVGRATRLVDRLADADKGYYGEIVLGVRTTTDDAEGEVIGTADPPPLDDAALDAALSPFRGPIQQTPPQFSAVKVAGQRAYDLARRGGEVRLRPREVTVHRLTLHWWRPPRLAVTIACLKGTYIRSIARDLGEALGCGAHLARLVRLWVGQFALEDALALDELTERVQGGRMHEALLPADVGARDLPAVLAEPRRAIDMGHGRGWRGLGVQGLAQRSRADVATDPRSESAQSLGASTGAGDDAPLARVYDTGGTLLGIVAADRSRGLWQPRLAIGRADAAGSDPPDR